MCGIAGMFDRSARRSATEADLRQMLALLRHRGPDEFGIFLDQETGLGSARLSIIDLSGGSQPITNEDETLWIVFNGEIFNYIELRAELEESGHVFRTSSDTEVILHLFEQHGPAALDRMNGQFAIAIWDTRRRRLFLARDRLGVRPLFYTELPDRTLIFASEIKSILSDQRVRAALDPDVIRQVFRFWAPLGPKTVFQGIRELPAGHYLLASADGLEVHKYWEPRFPKRQQQDFARLDTEATVEQFRELLIDACRVRLRADVPVGAYLSGGLDSSTIASIVRNFASNRLVTFSIAFTDEQFDESGFQQEMAAHLGTDHHVVRATHADIGEVFPDVIWHTETPVLRTAPAPMFLLSRLVRQHGFKVVLTGEGADEFLAGYDIFKEAALRRFWARQPQSKWRSLLLKRLYPDIARLSQSNSALLAAFFGEGLNAVDAPCYSHAIRWKNSRRSLRLLEDGIAADRDSGYDEVIAKLPAEFGSWEPLAQAQYLEITTFLSPYLLSSQGDRMGMAHSVEGRFPFLDARLVEFCNRLPANLKLKGLREKWLLKRAVGAWLPPAITRRPKRPYRAPIHRSFLGPQSSPEYVEEVLSRSAIEAGGIFKAAAIEQMVRKIKAGGAISETEDMALAGVLSTQLLAERFIHRFRRPAPLSGSDRVKVCRVTEMAGA